MLRSCSDRTLKAEQFGQGFDNGDVQEVLSHVPSPLWQEQIRARIAMGGVNLWVHDEENQLLAAGGIQLLWPGVGEGWLVVTAAGRQQGHQLAWLMRHEFRQLRERLGLWRLQSPVRCNWAAAQRLLRALGFQREGVMRQFGPDQRDYALYAWVRTRGADGQR